MAALTNTTLARLGSRFSLNFLPYHRKLLASPLGNPYNRSIRLEIAAHDAGARLVWPFSPGEPMGVWKQDITMSGVCFRCFSSRLGSEICVSFTAPFYPGDEKLSMAPFFYMEVLITPSEIVTEQAEGELQISLAGDEAESVGREDSALVLRGRYRVRSGAAAALEKFPDREFPGVVALEPVRGKMSVKGTTFKIPYSTDKGVTTLATFVLFGHCAEEVLDVGGEPHRFRYLQWFPTPSHVVAFAKDEEASVKERLLFFDDLFAKTSMGQSAKDLIACAFQAHLSTTWWTEPSRRKGADWFGFWNCEGYFNSAESEYPASFLYLNLWPQLLEKQLLQKAGIEEETGMLPVNCGRFLSAKPSGVWAADIEESCEYILTMFALWRWWDRYEPIDSNVSLLQRIGRFILDSDVAQLGTWSAPTLVSARLVFKIISALEALSLMSAEFGDAALCDSCSDVIKDMKETLERTAWQNDHFTLRPLAELENSGRENGEERAGGEEYSIGTADGLLYHFICDSFPEMDYALIKQDIISSLERTLSTYGCVTTTEGPRSISVSRNLARDIIGAYLGVNFERMTERYWNFQQSGVPRESSYIDSSESLHLLPDPRGAISIGILQALIGLKIDRVEGELIVSPLSVPAELPLLPLCSWEEMRAPRASVMCEGSRVVVEVSERDLADAGGELVTDPHPELRWGGS